MVMEYPGSLHNHTEMSNIRLRDSINRLDELINYAGELGHKTIAITEHEFTGNWVQVEYTAKKVKEKYPDLKIIRGNEIYLCRNGLNKSNFNKDYDRYYHFILLAKDLVGAKQIMEISTRAWKRSYISGGRMRRVPTYYQDLFDIIGPNPGHVIGSTACLGGALATQILRGTSDDKLELWINQLDSLFGHGNFFLEMQPSDTREQIIVNKKVYEFAKKLNIKYIITTDSHYLKKEDRPIHKAYLNAENGDREVDSFYATTYMMGTQELEGYFKYFSKEQMSEAYENILEIASMCEEYTLLKPLKIPELPWRPVKSYKLEYEEWFKRIPMLRTFATSEHKPDRYLVDAVIAGIYSHKDLQNQESYDELNDNLDRTWESSVVNKANWSAYYLNLQKNIDECWNAGTIVGPARGSGGGFTLLYCLDVIQMNKMREPTPMYPWRLTLRVKGLLCMATYLK